MKYGRYGFPYLLLHVGLGFVFLWIGIDMFRNPDTWIGYLPENPPFGLTRGDALQWTGVFDTILGILLIVRVFPKTTALLAALHIGAVLAQHGVDAVLVRDVGLLAVALALFTWPRHYKRHWWQRFLFRKKHSADED